MSIVSLTDGWLGTSNGSIYHLVNERPQRAAQLSTARIADISVAADGSLWAVTEAGEVLQSSDGGANWRMQAALGAPLSSVSAVSASDVWVLKDNRPWRWDGSTWGEITAAPLLSRLVVVSASEAWGTGGNQLWRWNGGAWSIFREFGGMWVDDLAAWPNGQVWVVGTDPAYPFHDPRVQDGAQLLHVWNGASWGGGIIASGGRPFQPARVNQNAEALCTLTTLIAEVVRCIWPSYMVKWADGHSAPVALGMVTSHDGWALLDALYRVHVPVP